MVLRSLLCLTLLAPTAAIARESGSGWRQLARSTVQHTVGGLIAEGLLHLYQLWGSDPLEELASLQARCQDLSVAKDNLESALADAEHDREQACGPASAPPTAEDDGRDASQFIDPGLPDGTWDDRLWAGPAHTDCELQEQRVLDLERGIAGIHADFLEGGCETLLAGLPRSPAAP